MRISIIVTDEVLEHPGDRYSAKKTVKIIEVEGMDADPQIVAATLRGAADRIYPPHMRNNISINPNTITTGTIYANG